MADLVSKSLWVNLDVSRVSLAVRVSQTVRVSWSGLIWGVRLMIGRAGLSGCVRPIG